MATDAKLLLNPFILRLVGIQANNRDLVGKL